MKKLLVLLIFFVCLSAAGMTAAKVADASDDRFVIHVLTFGRGEDLFSRFGHIAMVVDDRVEGTRKVYNFGTFDFADPALQLRYARGFLNYWVSVESYPEMVGFYKTLNRDIWLQTLNLTPQQATDVAERLRVNALPENRVYAYRHYIDNCCTRIRDLIDAETDGALSRTAKSEMTGRDFRYWTRRCLNGLPIFQSVILYSLGPAIDHPVSRWEEQFLPEVLMEDLDRATWPDARPLVLSTKHVAKRIGPDIGVEVPVLDKAILVVLVVLLALGLVVPALRPSWRVSPRLLGVGLLVWGLVAGLGGLMLLLYWTVTTHYDTHYNENLLVTPLTHLWLVLPGFRLIVRGALSAGMRRVLNIYLIASMGLIALDLALKFGPFIQGNIEFILIAAICNGLILFSIRRTE